MTKLLDKKFTFGFELEATYDHTIINYRDIETQFNEILGVKGDIHGDGSIRCTGNYNAFEYASGVLEATFPNLQKMANLLNKLPKMGIKVNRSCGFHVHLAYEGITKGDITWALLSMIGSDDIFSFKKMGRLNMYNNTYARFGFIDKIKLEMERGNYRNVFERLFTNEKYRAFRIHPQGTLEWRGPRTFLNVPSRKKTLTFVTTLYKFITTLSSHLNTQTIGDLTREMFNDTTPYYYGRVDFREHKKVPVKLFEKIKNGNSKMFDFLSEDAIKSIQDNITFDNQYELLGNINKFNNDKMFKTFLGHISINLIAERLPVDMFIRNIKYIGDKKFISTIFNELLNTPKINPELLKFLLSQITYNFGANSMKKFHKRSIFLLLDKGINSFLPHILKKDLNELYGEDFKREIFSYVYNRYNANLEVFSRNAEWKMFMNSQYSEDFKSWIASHHYDPQKFFENVDREIYLNTVIDELETSSSEYTFE